MKRRSGQALVEMTLVTPLVLLALATLINLGQTMHASVTIHTAMREGAQLAAYDRFYTDDEIKDVVLARAARRLTESGRATLRAPA